MGSIAALVLALVKPVLGRVLLALGFSVLTITGVAASVAALKSSVLSSFSETSTAVLQLAGLGGSWVALGALFGAMTFAVSMFGLRKATSLIGIGS